MARDPRHLVSGYATDSLAVAERSELLQAALEDQELFDALVEEEGLRELLSDPAARQEVLAVLDEPTGWERVRAWFWRPATLLDLGAVTALAAAALVGFALLTFPPALLRQRASAARPMGASLSSEQLASLLALPERPLVPAGIEVMGRAEATFAPGEALQLRVSLRAPARVALLSAPASGAPAQVWPGLGQPPALVPPPADGGPAILPVIVEAPPTLGTHRLRLVVAPADLDLGSLRPEAFAAAASRLTLVDLRYQVTRP
jgi:hypothetical protein